VINHRERLVWITCAGDPRDHAVPAATIATSGRAGAEVVAECGTHFWPAPLVAEPGPQCPRCIRQLRWSDGHTVQPVRQREGVIGRWLTAITGARSEDHNQSGVNEVAR